MSLMDNQYTVIRYHIYRELAKYREMQEERDSAVINDFAIPVLSGIVVGIVIKVICECMNDFIYKYIILLVVPIVLYVLILIGLKRLVAYYEKKLKPKYCPLLNKSKSDFRNNEEYYVARFNYEVTYLTKIAYNYALEVSDDEWLKRMSVLESCFHIRTALRKISGSLLLADVRLYAHRISSNRVYVVMGMLHEALERVEQTSLYLDEVEKLKQHYEDLREPIEERYQIELPSFNNQ